MLTNPNILLLAAAIGILQQFEGIKIIFIEKKKSLYDATISTLEFFWFLVAIYQLWATDLTSQEALLYSSFIIYQVGASIFGGIVLFRQGAVDTSNIEMPSAIYYSQIIFGCYYTVFSLLLWQQLA